MWTVRITPELLAALLAYQPADRMELAIILLAIGRIVENGEQGAITLTSTAAKRLNALVELPIISRDND